MSLPSAEPVPETRPALKVLLAAPRGFCAGVDRAIQIVELALAKFGAPVYVRHEIVHNRYVVESLKAKGAVFVEELNEIPETDQPVIFSAHGVPKSVPLAAKSRNLFAIDATCPLVFKVHMEAGRHHAEGRKIVLIGHAGHPEVEGTTGQLPPGTVTLIQTAADAEAFRRDEDLRLPASLDYAVIGGLSNEVREKLAAVRPLTLGQAARIEGVTPGAQEAVTKWAAAVAPLLGVLEGREEWKQAARQLTGALVEAVESREFDSLGHAQSVADVSMKLGRLVGLAGRELDELWFAATLHDLGKIHGESGHAQVGANFLHGVPHLAEAQKAIRHHHERWDGQGEPDKLAGEDIPLYARILAVANAFVRMGDVERLKPHAGKALDARLVGLLEKLPR